MFPVFVKLRATSGEDQWINLSLCGLMRVNPSSEAIESRFGVKLITVLPMMPTAGISAINVLETPEEIVAKARIAVRDLMIASTGK